jgi:hypothetical protein
MEDPMIGKHGRLAGVLVLAGGLSVSGCSPLGALDGVVLGPGPGTRASVVEGEVRSVDSRRGSLEVRDHWNRGYRVRTDRRTQVVYRQRSYPVSALERGDVVRVRVVSDRNGTLWADRVDVRTSARERGRVGVRTERVSGPVSRVDSRRGNFVVQANRHQSVLVYVPPRLNSSDARRFQRLRRGDHVRIEVVPVGRGAVELVRFR